MRLLALFVPPLLIAIPFVSCGDSPSTSVADAGVDGYIPLSNDATDDFAIDIPYLQEAAVVRNCKLFTGADPVGLCVQQAALESLHTHAFVAEKGAATSWSSDEAGNPDKGDGGSVPYTLDDTVAYAAAASSYLASAAVYGDTTLLAPLQDDLASIALQLETSFAVPEAEYSGELYFHLRTVAAGLRAAELDSDGAKFDKLADAYGRAILTSHYFPLGTRSVVTEGRADGGTVDGSAPTTDAGDAGAMVGGTRTPVLDGILGNSAGGSIAYSTADVATAAYALLDLVGRNPTDPLASGTSTTGWLAAARASLGHLQAAAIEPTTGMFYQSLVASKDMDGGSKDTLAPSTNPAIPNDALLADTQATFALAMVRAQYLVTSSTNAKLTGLGEAGGPVTDAGVSGPFITVLDLPFEAWADTTIKAMNGAHSLWDANAPDGGGARGGYMDGYVPSTKAFLTTKSTRANAFMAGTLARALVNDDPTLATLTLQLPVLVQLLVANSVTVPNSNLITVIPLQAAWLQGSTRTFEPLTSVPNPTSYTTPAVTDAVEGLTEQLFGKSSM